jgi:hypothetical protein
LVKRGSIPAEAGIQESRVKHGTGSIKYLLMSINALHEVVRETDMKRPAMFTCQNVDRMIVHFYWIPFFNGMDISSNIHLLSILFNWLKSLCLWGAVSKEQIRVMKKSADLYKPKELMVGKLYSFSCRILAICSVKNILIELERQFYCGVKMG